MLRLLSSIPRDENGATASEYAMLLVLVSLAIATGALALGNDLPDLLRSVGNVLSGIPLPTM